jgi:hypothetical protein
MNWGAKNPHGHGARTTHDTNKQANKSEEKYDPPRVPRNHSYSKIESNSPNKPPNTDSTIVLAIEFPTSKPMKYQGHSIE